METKEKIAKVRDQVYKILRDNPETRNDDRLLMLKYWAEVDGIAYDETFPVGFATQATSAETITRARRTVQNLEKEFLPTLDDVAKKRRIRQEELREYYALR